MSSESESHEHWLCWTAGDQILFFCVSLQRSASNRQSFWANLLASSWVAYKHSAISFSSRGSRKGGPPGETRVLLTLLYMLVTHWQRDPRIDHCARSHRGRSLTPANPSHHLTVLYMLTVNYWSLPLLQLTTLVLGNFWARLEKLHWEKKHENKMLTI